MRLSWTFIGTAKAQTYGPPLCKWFADDGLSSLHKRIRHIGTKAVAKMEIRAF